jgi:hypothetical protein
LLGSLALLRRRTRVALHFRRTGGDADAVHVCQSHSMLRSHGFVGRSRGSRQRRYTVFATRDALASSRRRLRLIKLLEPAM